MLRAKYDAAVERKRLVAIHSAAVDAYDAAMRACKLAKSADKRAARKIVDEAAEAMFAATRAVNAAT